MSEYKPINEHLFNSLKDYLELFNFHDDLSHFHLLRNKLSYLLIDYSLYDRKDFYFLVKIY